MPDEAQPAPAEAPQDTQPSGAPDTPVEDTGRDTPEEVNWVEEGPRYKQRYEDARPELDRTRQQVAEYEGFIEALQDPDTRAEALRQLDPELAELVSQQVADDDDEFVDPYEQRLSQLEQMLGERQTQEQQEALEEAEVGFINEQLEAIQKDTGQELSEQAAQVIGDLSQVNRDDNGYPDVRAAYEAVFNQLLPEQKKSWTDSKKAPRAAQGASAVENPDLDNERERAEYMAQRLAETEQ